VEEIDGIKREKANFLTKKANHPCSSFGVIDDTGTNNFGCASIMRTTTKILIFCRWQNY
jgi:hypothetical protein